MNNPYHISYNLELETIFWVKLLKFFYADPDPDPGWKKFGSGWEKVGSGIRNPEKLPGSTTLLKMLYIEDD
jgi:hypothetical protein